MVVPGEQVLARPPRRLASQREVGTRDQPEPSAESCGVRSGTSTARTRRPRSAIRSRICLPLMTSGARHVEPRASLHRQVGGGSQCHHNVVERDRPCARLRATWAAPSMVAAGPGRARSAEAPPVPITIEARSSTVDDPSRPARFPDQEPAPQMLGRTSPRRGPTQIDDALDARLSQGCDKRLRGLSLESTEVRVPAAHAVHEVVADLDAVKRGGKCLRAEQVAGTPLHTPRRGIGEVIGRRLAPTTGKPRARSAPEGHAR